MTHSPLCSVNMFSPWFLPSLALANRGLDLVLRTVSDPDDRARSLVCWAPMVSGDHYPNGRAQSATVADKHKGRPLRERSPDSDWPARMVSSNRVRTTRGDLRQRRPRAIKIRGNKTRTTNKRNADSNSVRNLLR